MGLYVPSAVSHSLPDPLTHNKWHIAGVSQPDLLVEADRL